MTTHPTGATTMPEPDRDTAATLNLDTMAARLFLADPDRPDPGPYAALSQVDRKPYVAMAQSALDYARLAAQPPQATPQPDDQERCCSEHGDCHLPAEVVCCDECPEVAKCGQCGHGVHLHDPEAVPPVCMVCGEACSDREARDLAEVIWTTSRADESTISATGANIVACAVLAAGFRRTPQPRTDTDLRERVEAVLRESRMTPYEDGKGGWLFRQSTVAEQADAFMASGVVAAPKPATVREAQTQVGFRYQDGEVVSPNVEVDSRDDEIPEVVIRRGPDDEWLTLSEHRADTTGAGQDEGGRPMSGAIDVEKCTCPKGCTRCGLPQVQMGNCPAWDDPCPLGADVQPGCPEHDKRADQ